MKKMLVIAILAVLVISGCVLSANTTRSPQTFHVAYDADDIGPLFCTILVTEHEAYRNNLASDDHVIARNLQLRAQLRQAIDHHFGRGGPQAGDHVKIFLPESSIDMPSVYLTYPKMEIVVQDGWYHKKQGPPIARH